MRTTAGVALVNRNELQIINAFRSERAVSGASARRLRELGLKDTRVLKAMVTSAVIRKAGPERYFLDEGMWASRRHIPVWALSLIAIGTLVAVGLGAMFLTAR